MSGNADNPWEIHMGNWDGLSQTYLVVAHCNVHPSALLLNILVNFMGNFNSIFLDWPMEFEMTDSWILS